MAAGDLTVNSKWATVECDDTVHTLTVEGVGGALTNIGSQKVYLSMEGSGALHRDGLQHDGEIELDSGDTVPVPAEGVKIRHQCLASGATKLWYTPKAG